MSILTSHLLGYDLSPDLQPTEFHRPHACRNHHYLSMKCLETTQELPGLKMWSLRYPLRVGGVIQALHEQPPVVAPCVTLTR
jgi:hypothetical protein